MSKADAPVPILIDCDPGTDDAVALLLAFAAPDLLDVRAVTVVAGNVPLAHTVENALKVRDLAGAIEVPVHAGCDGPLLGRAATAEHVHGDDGLGGVALASPSGSADPRHAVDALIDQVEADPGAITICATGPLTNVALALAKRRDIVPKIARIVLMGGAVGVGNVTPAAEFNIYADPYAARIVFEAGVPLVMIGLDVTHQVRATVPRLAALRALGSDSATAVAGFMDRGAEQPEGGALHDPCTIAYLMQPDLFRGRPAHVAIETEDGPTLGRTVCDFTSATPNATVMMEVDAEGVFALLSARLSP